MTQKKPAVCLYQNNAPGDWLNEICAGLEEEGVLFEILEQAESSVNRLACEAAHTSVLQVGLGVNAEGAAMQMRNKPACAPIFSVINPDAKTCRRLGQNAARAVKGGVFI